MSDLDFKTIAVSLAAGLVAGLALSQAAAGKPRATAGKPRAAVGKPEELEVGYWTIRGLGAPCRAMVLAAGVRLRATCHDVIPTPDGKYDRSDYVAKRVALREQNPLANLPYVIDEHGTLIAQTNACFLYLGRRLDMLGDGSAADVSKCEQLLCEAMDLRNSMTRNAYGKGDQADACQQVLEGQLSGGSMRKLENWLKVKTTGSKLYFVGSKLSAPDFHIWEQLDQYTHMADHHELDSPLDGLPHLKAFYDNFSALPQNQAYLNSPLHQLPFNQKMAKFGGAKNRGAWDHGTMTEGSEHYDFANISGVFHPNKA